MTDYAEDFGRARSSCAEAEKRDTWSRLRDSGAMSPTEQQRRAAAPCPYCKSERCEGTSILMPGGKLKPMCVREDKPVPDRLFNLPEPTFTEPQPVTVADLVEEICKVDGGTWAEAMVKVLSAHVGKVIAP